MTMPKREAADLAVCGGTPLFAAPLHVGAPNVGDRARLMERLGAMLDSRWFTNNGPLMREFESRLQAYLGVRHCIALVNGTVALEIAARALDLRGEVIVPSFTFVATAHALQWLGLTPVFADIEPRSFTLDPADVERRVTPRTTAIMGVHAYGNPCHVEALAELARRRGLRLLFDAAHAFGCAHAGRMIGAFGDAEVFSFHATKFFNSFEGGAITTNDDALAERVRLMRNFGFSGRYDEVVSPGTNGKMTEVCAAMGLTSLDSIDTFLAANRRNYAAYRRGLAGLAGLEVMDLDGGDRRNWQYVIARVNAGAFGLSRDALVRVLHAENVLARRYFHPGCHRQAPYAAEPRPAGLALPVTERAAEEVLAFPTGTAVGPEAVEAVCGLVRAVAAWAPALKERGFE